MVARKSIVLSVTCVVSLLWTTAAYAAWSGSTATRATGGLGMATIGWEFTPVRTGPHDGDKSGTGGRSYVSKQLGNPEWVMFDLTNESTVTTNPRVRLDTDFMNSLPSVRVYSCPTPWTPAATCDSGMKTVATTWTADNTLTASYGVSAPGSTLHMAVNLGPATGNVVVTAAVDQMGFRTGTDRTRG